MSKNKNKGHLKPGAPASWQTSPQEIILERSRGFLPESEFELLQAELAHPLRSAVRINPLKLEGTPEAYLDALRQRYAWETEPIPYCHHGWWVGQPEISPGQTWEHRLGRYYVQDASSMLPVELFDLTDKQPLILDMAASPGGKTTHLASKFGDRGFILANDVSRDRITALKVVLQNWGAISQCICQFNAENFGAWFPNTFDLVLLDAPCSMQSLRSTEARPLRSISEREVGNLANRQKQLLESALLAARPGGQIVYATCTLMPEEDEAVLDWLVHKYPSAFTIDNLHQRHPYLSPGLSQAYSQPFDPAVKNALRVWPHNIRSSGFFCARLTKTSSLALKQKQAPSFDIAKTSFSKMEQKKVDSLCNAFLHHYNFDLASLIASMELELWELGDTALAFPLAYFNNFPHLPLRSIGMPVARKSPSEWVPDHYFVCRFFNHFLPASALLPPELCVKWQNGMDIEIDLAPLPGVLIVRSESNEFLGVARQMPGLLKNLLPKRARI